MARSPKVAAGSQSLERGLDVLEVVEAEGADIGVREIARRLDLSPTIVQRMVTSLAKRGYVAMQRNSITVNDEWLANTTMQKTLGSGPASGALQ